MKISEQEVQQCHVRRSWLAATIQIQKDLSWQNLVTIEHIAEESRTIIKTFFSFLEQGQYQTLMNIFYRVDVGRKIQKPCQKQWMNLFQML